LTWTEDDSLRLIVVMGLRAGLKLCRGMRRSLTEDEQNKVAAAIVAELKRNNWKIALGAPLEGHGQHLRPPKSDEER
jgi:hypothetical protein